MSGGIQNTRQPSAMPWPSSAVNSGPRRFSQAHGITETRRNSQPTCSTAFCSSPVGRPDLQSQAHDLSGFKYHSLDMRDGTTVDEVVSGVGELDVLVNCVGKSSGVREHTPSGFEEVCQGQSVRYSEGL